MSLLVKSDAARSLLKRKIEMYEARSRVVMKETKRELPNR